MLHHHGDMGLKEKGSRVAQGVSPTLQRIDGQELLADGNCMHQQWAVAGDSMRVGQCVRAWLVRVRVANRKEMSLIWFVANGS